MYSIIYTWTIDSLIN